MQTFRELYAYLGLLFGVPAFLATWWFCIAEYGLLAGLTLGWLAALIVASAYALLWPVTLVVSLAAIASGEPSGPSISHLVYIIGWFEAVTIAVLLVGGLINGSAASLIWAENWSKDSVRNRRIVIAAFPALICLLFLASLI